MQHPLTIVLVSIITGLSIALAYLTWTSSPPQGPAVASYAPAVERSMPSVVNIYSQREIMEESQELWNNPIFSGFGERLQKPQRSSPRLGSGVIIDSSGHVLTNYHVVKMTSNILVSLADGSTSPATIVGADSDSDLAVLKLQSPIGEPATIASTAPRLGDIVLAIGNAYGVGQAVTQGIVSGLGRTNLGLANIENYIQTDVAINPGNSGGALVNTQGELVGIVTAVFSSDGAYQGISFAIPAEVALRISRELISKGKVTRGYLGVEMHDLTPYEADFFGLGSTAGLLITDIHPDSPAEQARLEPGDVLLKINGEPVESTRESQAIVAGSLPGSRLRLTVFRRGQETEVTATLVNRPLEIN